MKRLITLFRRYRTFYVLSLSVILLGLVGLLLGEKGDLVLYFNSMESEKADGFFLWMTLLGEITGGIIVFLMLLLLAERRFILVFIASVILSTSVTQGLKHSVFKGERRPIVSYDYLKPIEDLDRHRTNSFPSGHTTAAFTFMSLLALGIKRKSVQVIAPLLGGLIGLSRVYLGQHYLNDIVAGAVLGLFLTSIVYYVFQEKKWI